MAKKSVAKNYIYNLCYQVLIVVLPIITTPYISRVLGAENIGIYSYTYSIVSYFILFGSLGVALYGKREVAYVQQNIKERSKVFWEILLFRALTILIATVAYVIFFLNFELEYQTYYIILILEVLAAGLDISWFLQGMEEFKKTVTRNIIVRLLSVTAIFVFVKTPEDLVKYTLIYSLGNFLGNLMLWVYLPKFMKGAKVDFKSLNIKRHILPIIVLFVPQITEKIYNMLDKTMIGVLVADKSEVGFYEQAQKTIRILNTVVASLGIVMVPRMATIFETEGKEKVQETLKKSFRFVFFISVPLTLGIISILPSFVPMFYGPGYDKVKDLIIYLSPIILLMGIENVIGTQYLIPTKQQKKYTISVSVGLAVNVVLNYILIIKYQAIGAAISTIISQFIVDMLQMIQVRDELDLKEMFKPLFKYVLVGILMFVLSVGTGYVCENKIFIKENNLELSEYVEYILTITLQVFVGGITYIGILIISKDSLIMPVLNRVTARFKKVQK